MTASLYLRAFFEEAMDAMAIADDSGCYIDANPAACELFGVSLDDLLGRCIADFSQVEFNFSNAWQQFLEQGRQRGEFTLVRPDGTVREVEYAATAHFVPHRHLSVLRDVTERRQLERQVQALNQELEQQVQQRTADLLAINAMLQATNQQLQAEIYQRQQSEIALRQSELRFLEISNSSPANIYILVLRQDGSLYLEHMSRAIEEILEYSVAQVIENPDLLVECIHPDDRATYDAAVQRSLFGLVPFSCEWRVITPSGRVKWLKGSSRPKQRENGEIAWYGVVLDVTDRKTAEVALRQREQEFRTLAENAPDCIMRCDRQFRFLYVNPAVESLTGIPAAQFIGLTSQDLGFPEALVNLWHGAMEQIFATGQGQVLEYDIPSPRGVFTFNSRIVPELTAEGAVASVLIVARDITTLRQAQDAFTVQAERERALRLITQRIRETLNLAQILDTAVQEVLRALQADRALVIRLDGDRQGVVIQEAVRPEYPPMLNRWWDGEGFLGIWNPANALGDPQPLPDGTLGGWREETQVAVPAKLIAPIAKTLEDGSGVTWGLLMIHACAKPRVWKPEEADLLQQVANQLAIAIQQSELHQQIQQSAATLEQQVQERTAELQQALDFEAALKRITDKVRDSLDERKILQAVVQELGQTLRVQCCDTAIYDLERRTSTIYCEYAPSDQSAEGMVLPMDDHPEIYAQLLQGTGQQFCFHRLEVSVSRDLMHRSAIFTQPIRDDQGSLGDIWLLRSPDHWFSESEIRLVQQVANQCAIALRQSRLFQAAQAQVTELERLNRLKDDFLSTVSHELRTPMANIKLATDLLEIHLQRLGLLPEPDQYDQTPFAQYFQILKDEGQREIRLINDLLDLTRIDAEAEPLMLSTFALQDWLPHVLEPFWERVERQQQQFTLALSSDLPPITTDASLLQQVLGELLTNACKYTPAGERIEVSATATATLLNLCVANTGVEVPAAECDRIFDRFYRIPNLDPWKHSGMGLGLALTKKRVEYLGGMIWAECGARRLSLMVQLPLERSPLCQNPTPPLSNSPPLPPPNTSV